MASPTKWPKIRPELSPDQEAVFADWNREFSGSIKSSRFSRVSTFDHTFPLASYGAGQRTLEIGAGSGTHLAWEREGQYVALERSAEVAKLIPQRDGLEIITGDCEKSLPYEDDTFDRVLAIHVLEHLYNLPGALREVRRVLKPSGLFSVVIPCEGGLTYSLGRTFTSKRIFERRYGTSYEWLIRYDHCNTAREVLAEVAELFTISSWRYWPLRIPSIDLNISLGLECRI